MAFQKLVDAAMKRVVSSKGVRRFKIILYSSKEDNHRHVVGSGSGPVLKKAQRYLKSGSTGLAFQKYLGNESEHSDIM